MKKTLRGSLKLLSPASSGQARSNFLKCRSRIPFLACLSEREARALEAEVVERKFSKGQTILLEEDTCNFLYIVYSGKVKAVRTGADGNEHILAIHRKGDFFGEMGIIDGMTSPAAVVAMDDSEIGLIEKKSFEAHLLSNPKTLRALMSVLSERLKDAWGKVKILSHTDARSRVKAVLELMAERYGVKDHRGTIISMKLTHMDIARFSSLSRETVTRQLLRFTEAEAIAILDDKCILLKDEFFNDL